MPNRRALRPKLTDKINFDTVRDIGLTLPGVEEGTAYGSPVLKAHGKLLAGIAVNRSAEPGSLMLRVDSDDRAELLAADPEIYYVTDHYVDNAVLVRFSRQSRCVAGLARHGLQVCDPQCRASFAIAEGPLTESKFFGRTMEFLANPRVRANGPPLRTDPS